MVNFAYDAEREEDYEIGWDWIEEDTGPLIGPYTGHSNPTFSTLKDNGYFQKYSLKKIVSQRAVIPVVHSVLVDTSDAIRKSSSISR